MKVLWITNIMMPPLCESLGMRISVGGGWMYSSAKKLIEGNALLNLAIATVYPGNQWIMKEIGAIKYYVLPLNGKKNTRYNKHLEAYWKKVYEEFRPDLVHIHGSEFPHGLAYVNALPFSKTVVSIQGLVSVCARYYNEGLSCGEILRNITLRDLLKENLWQAQRSFYRRGMFEQELITKVHHVIGRTSWDYAHTLAINPSINYHFCNETLREEFYKHRWSYNACEKHSLFLTQAGYPIKGFLQVLKALPFVIKKYPDIKVYVAGTNILSDRTWKDRLKRTGYAKIVKQFIKKQKLGNYIIFTGPLDEKAMCIRFLKSNIFICPSSIENSPNSLGEAQLLGVPCIASFVGGIPDMIPSEACGSLYRFEEVEMLADSICMWLEKSKKFDNTEMRKISALRHDSERNKVRLNEIYNEILQNFQK